MGGRHKEANKENKIGGKKDLYTYVIAFVLGCLAGCLLAYLQKGV